MKITGLRFAATAAASTLAFVAPAALAQNLAEMQLHAAARECRPGEIAQLLDRGTDINAQGSGGHTALAYAVSNGCTEGVRLLLARGADRTIKDDSGFDPAYLAKINNYRAIMTMLAAPQPAPGAPAAPAVVAAPAAPAPEPARVPVVAPPAPAPVAPVGARGWPKLGHYQVGRQVLYSGSGGKTWNPATIKSIDPTYGYNFPEVSGSSDPYFVVGTAREPFWTGWFVGDWKVSVPMAMNTMTDGRYVYRVVSGGMRLPPLRIAADGTYTWRYAATGGEKLLRGRWEPNPNGPGVILKNAAEGADWLVYNNSRTGSTLGETVILSSDCCSHYDGVRLGR